MMSIAGCDPHIFSFRRGLASFDESWWSKITSVTLSRERAVRWSKETSSKKEVLKLEQNVRWRRFGDFRRRKSPLRIRGRESMWAGTARPNDR